MRHPLHSICPYFAMFPESFVATQLLAYSRPGDLIFDPFCGRGTTILEGLLNHRHAIGLDINPVAVCIAGAKAQVPEPDEVLKRISELEFLFQDETQQRESPSAFFDNCFHSETLQEILFLREYLNWQHDRVDRFIAAVLLGALHGESHKSEMYLSNRMPRTISTKPDYSIRWWHERGLKPPHRSAFEVARRAVHMRYAKAPPSLKGKVVLSDARLSNNVFSDYKGKVSLIVTSPPYLDTTDYAEDQWLRLWFLGGPSRPSPGLHKDDRHTRVTNYWAFLSEIWSGCKDLLKDGSTIVVRIGGTKLDKTELLEGLENGLRGAMTNWNVRRLHDGATSVIGKRQTNSFRPGTSKDRHEHDFAFKVHMR